MKSTGIVRRIDDLGRIVVPKELRKVLKIKEGDPLEIFVDGEDVILRKHKSGCDCCGEMEGLVENVGIKLCKNCIEKFKKL